MKQTLIVKLAPEPHQHAVLLRTLETFNAACNTIADVAFAHRCTNKITLQKLVYRDVRQHFGLSAQMAIRAIAVPEPAPDEPTGYLGVDLGIKNVAADSDGETYAGGHLNGLRQRHARLRSRLQRKGTKSSAKRLLKKRRRKERRFATNVNHIISKRLVAKAKGTGRGIALEDLTGIRERLNGSKAQRRSQHSWAFRQLRAFIEYKARLAGVPVVLVDPRHTSRTCPACGCIDKRNRPTQARFSCVSCGFAGPADTIAAGNIARRAAVMQPHAASAQSG
jgi:putative transposase